MDKRLKEIREEVIATVRTAIEAIGRVNSTVVLIDNQYLTYIKTININDTQEAIQSIENLKDEGKEILAFFYIDNIMINNEIKVAIAESYVSGDFKINIFDICERAMSINQELSEQQTNYSLQKEQRNNIQDNGFNFPMLGNWLN